MNQMKRIIALALSLVFVFAGFATVYATAAEQAAKLTKGDVNANGKIDMTDYILTKRAYFNTFTLDEEQLDRADINNNGKLDMTDYILLKRIYFGTYPIPVTPEEPEEDTSSDVIEDSSDVVEDSSDVIEDSSDVIEDSSDVVEDSSDVVEDSSDVIEDSSDVIEDSSDVIDESSDVVIPTDDEVDPEVSDDTSSDDTSSDDTSSDDTSDDEPALGTFDNPYLANLGEMRIVVTLEPGAEAYVKANDSDGNILKVGYATGADYAAYYCRQQYNPEGEDNAMAITMNADVDFVCFMNSSDTDTIVLYIVLEEGEPVEIPAGSMDNPIEITLSEMFGALRGSGEGEALAGGQGVYFKVVAPDDGMIMVSVGASDAEYNNLDWMYSVNNETAGKYGDYHWSDDDPVVYNEMLEVSKDDVIIIFVNTYDPADMWNCPAGTVSANVSFAANGSYSCPEEITTGDQTTSLAEGSQGYYYTYTATADGTLTLTIADSNTIGWTYSIGNKTQSIYGDTHWNDDDPVVYSESIPVVVGDVVEIMINTYDPENPWAAPAGDIDWSLSFTETESINLVSGKEYVASAEGVAGYTGDNFALTDGVTNRWTTYNSSVFGFSTANTTDLKGYFIFDLGAYCTISSVDSHINVFKTSGIVVPTAINVYTSVDGETYEELGTSTLPTYDTSTGVWDEVRWANCEARATGVRFVKVEFVIDYGFNFVDEIQVMGYVTEELETEEDTSSDEIIEDSSNVEESSDVIPTDDEVDPDESSEVVEDSSDEIVDDSSDVVEPVVNPESNVVNVWNTNYSASTDAIIFTDAAAYSAANMGWWRNVAFAPVEGKTGIYEVVAISSGDAGASGGLEMPENGFIWCAYEWPAAGSIGANVISIMNLLAVGTTIEVTGIDIAAGTNTADANIAIWVDPTTPGIISMGSSYTASIETYWTMDGFGVSTKPTTALTDGIKGTNDFWKDAYVCYSGVAWATGVSITVDLEEANNLTSFNAYCLAPGMGINVPTIGETLTKIEIYDEETSAWVEVDCTVTDTVESFTDSWGNAVARHLYTFTVNGEPVVSSQVRFTLSAWGQFLMLDEVEVIGYAAN